MKVFCPNCGADLENNRKDYCEVCGNDLPQDIHKTKSRRLPEYSVASLVLTILSFHLPVVGLITAIVSHVLAAKSIRIYDMNPEAYQSKDMAKVSKIMSLICILYQLVVIPLLTFLVIFLSCHAESACMSLEEFFKTCGDYSSYI